MMRIYGIWRIAGGSYFVHYYDTILEYDTEEDVIITVGQMIEARDHHAVSVVQSEDYSKWCEWLDHTDSAVIINSWNFLIIIQVNEALSSLVKSLAL